MHDYKRDFQNLDSMKKYAALKLAYKIFVSRRLYFEEVLLIPRNGPC